MYALAIIPGIILFIIIWKFDTVEKEPPALLLKLFIGGGLTVITAVLIGLLGDRLMKLVWNDARPIVRIFINSFIFTALVEEGGKLIVLKLITWKDKEFNYTFDGIVYAAATALGFAVFENAVYMIKSTSDTFFVRVLLLVIGNIIFSIYMGYFYGLARYSKGAGSEKEVRKHMAEALLVPMVMHGFYVFCLRTEKPAFTILFAIYVTIITVITVKQFIKLSKNDTLIPGMDSLGEENEGKM